MKKEQIIKLYVENVERFILIANRYLRSKEKAEDIVHECFRYMIEKKDALTGDVPELRTYMLLLIKSRCINMLKQDVARRENLQRLYAADMNFLYDDNISRKMLELDMRKLMDKAGMEIPKRAFDIYVSCKIGGLSHKELAKLYGVAQSRVAKDISKANKIMQILVQDYLHVIALLCFLIIGRLC